MTFEVNINFEDSWHSVGTDLEWISPLNLSDGFYTFKVRTKDIAEIEVKMTILVFGLIMVYLKHLYLRVMNFQCLLDHILNGIIHLM